jgi:hypothetical protein
VFYFKNWMAGDTGTVGVACFAFEFQGAAIEQIVARVGEFTTSNLECMKRFYLASQAGMPI